MRKTSAALASLSLVALALTGCAGTASFDGQSCDRTDSAGTLADGVTVSGDFGVTPKVEVYAPYTSSTAEFTDLIEGEGTPLTSPDQVFSFDYAFFDGGTGAQIEQSAFAGDLSQVTTLNSIAQSIPGVVDVLQCATPGTRVLASIPNDALGNLSADPRISADSPLIAVFDVLDTALARAHGSLQFNDAHGMPTVVRAPDGRPGIIIPGSAAPTKQVEQVLIKGDGDEITADDKLVWVNYTAVDWDTKKQTATSWDGNPTPNIGQVDPALADVLVGRTIGSQLLVVVPGTGDDASATAYVIDILGIPVVPEQ